MKLFVVDGNAQLLDGGTLFGKEPKKVWEEWIAPDASNRILFPSRCLLWQTDDGKNFLFDVGVGAFLEPEKKALYGIEEKGHVLLKNLHALGIEENAIDGVILSHLHFQHAGGLLPEYGDELPSLLFPSATYYVSAPQWEAASHPTLREEHAFIPLILEFLGSSNRLALVDPDNPPQIDKRLTFHFSDGHTVGMLLSEITTEEGPLLFTSDLVPGRAWVDLSITMGYDRFPEQTVAEKKALFEAIAGKDARLFFTHDPEIACAYLKQDETGRFFAEPTEL